MSVSAATKKRKHSENLSAAGGSSSKKPKKDDEPGKKRDEKGKGRAADSTSAFRVASASVVLSIPPVFAMEPMKGVAEMLDSLIMKYVPALRGVLLAHSNVKFLSHKASIKAECPFAVCTVGFDATIWSPLVGSKLSGKIKLCSPDHIALLVLRTFNVSIPRHHIVTENWEFQYGPTENDPEFASSLNEDCQDDAMAVDAAEVEGDADDTVVGGLWLNKTTGDMLGGTDGILEFTVIGLKVANQMLSLVGSLQEDPFSERHVPLPVIPAQLAPAETGTEDEIDELEDDDDDDDLEIQERRLDPSASLDDSSDEELPLTISQMITTTPATKTGASAKGLEMPEGHDAKKKKTDEETRAKDLRKKEKEEKKAAKELRRKEKEERREEKEKRRAEKKEAKKKEKEEKKEKKKRKQSNGGDDLHDAVELDPESPNSGRKKRKTE